MKLADITLARYRQSLAKLGTGLAHVARKLRGIVRVDMDMATVNIQKSRQSSHLDMMLLEDSHLAKKQGSELISSSRTGQRWT